MFARRCVQGLLLLCFSAVVCGCASSGLDSIQVTPATQALSVGQTAQFSAVGTYGSRRASWHCSDTAARGAWAMSTPRPSPGRAEGTCCTGRLYVT
jgi:hypothetical protein